MKIDNNVNCPNFTALRIRPSAQKALQKASLDTVKMLERVGEELKDTMFYHLEIGSNLSPHVMYNNRAQYRAPFMTYRQGHEHYIQVDTIWDGVTELNTNPAYRFSGKRNGARHLVTLNMGNSEKAIEAYNTMRSKETEIEKAAEFVKLLDADKKRKVDPVVLEKMNFQKALENLLNKFGMNNITKI